MNRQIRSIYSHGNCLIQKFRKCSENVKAQLFKSYCTNMYGIQLWADFTPSTLDKVRVAYNNVFRTFMSVDRRSSVSAAFIKKGINHFNVLYRKAVYGFKTRLSACDNLIVQN